MIPFSCSESGAMLSNASEGRVVQEAPKWDMEAQVVKSTACALLLNGASPFLYNDGLCWCAIADAVSGQMQYSLLNLDALHLTLPIDKS